MKALVTGGAGFIGTSVVRRLLDDRGWSVVNLDKLTYAGSNPPLGDLASPDRYWLEVADICDRDRVDAILDRHRPDAILHLAAETHVDRSIDRPDDFIAANVAGTCSLLEAARGYWSKLDRHGRDQFRFLHVSTDEVFGALDLDSAPVREDGPFRPNSPYAASKAGAEHLVRAWRETYGLPVIITRCSNNYGPWQFPEKLIPLMILNAIEGRPLPVYGRGENIRDWIHVDDHTRALLLALEKGRPGECYHIGGGFQRRNIDLVRTLCGVLDEEAPRPLGLRHRDLIAFVEDRPGHDLRYAIDDTKIRRELGWAPRMILDEGLRATVRWYLANADWWRPIRERIYRGGRLGLGAPAEEAKE